MKAGDLLRVDFGIPTGSEPGFLRPAVVVTADLVLAGRPRTIHVVPVTGNVGRGAATDVAVEGYGLDRPSVAQCHLCALVSVEKVVQGAPGEGVGVVALAQIRNILGDLFDID